MSLRATDLNLLYALRALLEEVNVTQAARRLGMSQPAMSSSLARLRRQFGDELLVRSSRDLELTPRARDLLPQVQEALRSMEAVVRVGQSFEPATSQRLFRIMLSDYALSVIYQPLIARVREAAPGVRVEFADMGADVRNSERAITDHDVLIGPLGYGFPGTSEPFFRDRMVCLVDRRNGRLRAGQLTMADLAELPHALASFGRINPTPVDRLMSELGVSWRAQVAVHGWLALLYVVEGTDLVAVVPERLVHGLTRQASLAVVEPPFGDVELLEGIWFDKPQSKDTGHGWLMSVLRDVARSLAGPAQG